jgi:hypothetical protein
MAKGGFKSYGKRPFSIVKPLLVPSLFFFHQKKGGLQGIASPKARGYKGL